MEPATATVNGIPDQNGSQANRASIMLSDEQIQELSEVFETVSLLPVNLLKIIHSLNYRPTVTFVFMSKAAFGIL